MVAEQRQRLGLSWYLAANYYLPKGIVYCLHLPPAWGRPAQGT